MNIIIVSLFERLTKNHNLQLSGISGNTYGSERSSFSRDAHLLDSDSVAQKVSHVIWKDAAACPISAAFAQISRLNNRESGTQVFHCIMITLLTHTVGYLSLLQL